PGGVQQLRPARHGEEEIVVAVRVAVPAIQHLLQRLAQLLAPRLRQQAPLVGHDYPSTTRRVKRVPSPNVGCQQECLPAPPATMIEMSSGRLTIESIVSDASTAPWRSICCCWYSRPRRA